MKIIPLRGRILIKNEGKEKKTKGGTIDSAKLIHLAHRNAPSIAGLLLSTDVMVVEKPKKKKTTEMPEE